MAMMIDLIRHRAKQIATTVHLPSLSASAVMGTAVTTTAAATFLMMMNRRQSTTTTTGHHGNSTIYLERPPNQLTRHIGQMKQVCPDVMQQYATCVLQAQEEQDDEGDGTSSGARTLHRACEAEFQAVKECFRQVRRQQQQ